MTYSTTNTSDEDRAYFRCPVVGEKGKATLHVGFKKIKATVMEASITGYTITVNKKYAKRLKRSKEDWVISYDDTKALVKAESVSEPEGELVRIGLCQKQDLTKPEKIKVPLWSRIKPTFGDSSSTASVAYGGFVLLLFAAMALPGLGDSLGTSDRIQDTFRWLLRSADQQVEMWTR